MDKAKEYYTARRRKSPTPTGNNKVTLPDVIVVLCDTSQAQSEHAAWFHLQEVHT